MVEHTITPGSNETVTAIVEAEWTMFQAVNQNNGARASCQEDYDTFCGMRRSQFAAWSEEAALSYLDDLATAKDVGRNLLAEKYLFMMIIDSPESAQSIAPAVQMPQEQAFTLVEDIWELQLQETVAVRAKFPHLGLRGRPLLSDAQRTSGDTSVQTYQMGEMLTYSVSTLEKLLAHIKMLSAQGVSLVESILLNEMQFYGYTSLEQAEKTSRQQDFGYLD